jgi:ABC-type Fe3+-hydroxamate transport system substrate-binding protein
MRVVSLVPSATETLVAIGVVPVACTRFCEQPGLPTIGGTKNPEVDAIVALEPDVVVMNDEENRREDRDALVTARLTVHSMSPRSVADVGPAIAALAHRVGAATPDPFGPAAWAEWLTARAESSRTCRSSVTFVWRRPWMTLAADTYGASLLHLLGLDQVSFPGGDRYPTVMLDDVGRAAPAVVLLPSEPYVFSERHRAEVVEVLPGADVRLIDGRDLFWWGVRTPAAADRLGVVLR